MLDTLIAYQSLDADEQALYRGVRQARAYADGQQHIRLTDRMRAVLGNDFVADDADRLRLNACHTVLNAVVERLAVRGFACEDDAIAAWLWRVWQANAMDIHARDAHFATGRDGEYGMLVTWDDVRKRVTLHGHGRYVAGNGDVPGDNDGVRFFYQDDNPRGELEYATKRWIEQRRVRQGNRIITTSRRRVTFFFPDEIVKYEERGAELIPLQDDGDVSWPLPNLHKDGSPMGVLVVPITNPGLASDIKEAIPLQNLLNMAVVGLATGFDQTAMRILFGSGWHATSDGTPTGAPLPIEPGIIYSSSNPDADLKALEGADMAKLAATVDHTIGKIAQVTDTPVNRFITTAQVSSAEGQKSGEGPLIGKIQQRQTHYGNGWQRVMELARRLHNTYSDEPELDESLDITTLWEPAVVRDETQELQRAEAKQRLGIPQRQIWLELGYSQEQVDMWEAERVAKEEREMQMQQAQAAGRGMMPVG